MSAISFFTISTSSCDSDTPWTSITRFCRTYLFLVSKGLILFFKIWFYAWKITFYITKMEFFLWIKLLTTVPRSICFERPIGVWLCTRHLLQIFLRFAAVLTWRSGHVALTCFCFDPGLVILRNRSVIIKERSYLYEVLLYSKRSSKLSSYSTSITSRIIDYLL